VKTFSSIGDFFTRIFGWGGRSSGPERGPKAGDGAVVHHSSGEADFNGLSGDVPPPVKDANRDLPYPPKNPPIKLPFATIQYIGSVIGPEFS
jgi:hypothetical protein